MTQRPADPVLARRAQITRLVGIGKRIGYGLYLVAIIGFILAFTTGQNETWVVVVIGSMLIGSVFLLPAIIFGYGVKAAEREERRAAAGGTSGRH